MSVLCYASALSENVAIYGKKNLAQLAEIYKKLVYVLI